jgi:hypothetical protein
MNRGVTGEAELAAGEAWAIYSTIPDRLPTSPGRMLVTSAVDEIVRRVRAARSPVREPFQPMPDGTAWHEDRLRVASDLANLLRARSVSSTGRRVGGGPPISLTRMHWDGDAHLDVVATGVIHIETAPDEWTPHWVFLEEAQVEFVASIQEAMSRPNGPYINPEYVWPTRLEEMARLLLGNVKKIVGGEEETEEARGEPVRATELDRLVALLTTERMSPVQRDAVVEQATDWLKSVFKEEAHRVAKPVYRKKAVAQFGEAVAGRVFDDIWKEATRKSPNRRKGGRIPKVR